MGKREDRRYGWRLAVLTFVLLCLQGTGGQAYAQEDKVGERRIRYSSSYLKEAEIPEAPEEYLEEGEITYRLVGTEIEAVPVRGRTREVSGEMVYPSVTREQEIPARAPMEVEDRESRKTVLCLFALSLLTITTGLIPCSLWSFSSSGTPKSTIQISPRLISLIIFTSLSVNWYFLPTDIFDSFLFRRAGNNSVSFPIKHHGF